MKTKDTIVLTIIVALVAVASLVIGAGMFNTGGSGIIVNRDAPTSFDCNIAPTVSVSAVDAIKTGTAVSDLTVLARVNGNYVGTASAYNYRGGDQVELLVSKSDFLDTTISQFTAQCGANSQVAKLYATDAASIRVFNDLNNIVTNNAAGGAVNQSPSANVIRNKVELSGVPAQSTGAMIIVVEASNTSQVSSLTLSGASVVNTPKFFSPSTAGAIVSAFRVPAIVDGGSAEYTLNINPESGETIDGTSVRIFGYSEQAFVDTDGSFKVGIEDENGNVKYEDSFSYAYLIG